MTEKCILCLEDGATPMPSPIGCGCRFPIHTHCMTECERQRRNCLICHRAQSQRLIERMRAILQPLVDNQEQSSEYEVFNDITIRLSNIFDNINYNRYYIDNNINYNNVDNTQIYNNVNDPEGG